MVDQVPHQKPGGMGLGICEASGENYSLSVMNDDALFTEVVGVEVDSFDGLPDLFVPKTVKGCLLYTSRCV